MNTKLQVPKEADLCAHPRQAQHPHLEEASDPTKSSLFSGLAAILCPEKEYLSPLREFGPNSLHQGHLALGPANLPQAGQTSCHKKLLRISSKLALALGTTGLNHGPKNLRFNLHRFKGSPFGSEASERSPQEASLKKPSSPPVEHNPLLDTPVSRISSKRILSLQADSQVTKNLPASHGATLAKLALPTKNRTKQETRFFKPNLSLGQADSLELESIQRNLLTLCRCYASKKTGKSFPEEEADPSKKQEGLCSQLEVARQLHLGLQPGDIAAAADHESIFRMCSESKERSLQVQALLQSMPQDQLEQFTGFLSTKLEVLLVDRFASYVVQHLIEVDAKTLAAVSRIVAGDFLKFATNEYSSRLMQRIFALDPDFCKQVLLRVPGHFDEIISCFSRTEQRISQKSIFQPDALDLG